MPASLEEICAFFDKELPLRTFDLVLAHDGTARARQRIDTSNHLRPGGTVAGPVLMALADVATYAALLSRIGIVPLAVTSNLNISFLRRPPADRAVVADASLLKLGRKLAVAEVRITSEGADALLAHATVSYALPSENGSP